MAEELETCNTNTCVCKDEDEETFDYLLSTNNTEERFQIICEPAWNDHLCSRTCKKLLEKYNMSQIYDHCKNNPEYAEHRENMRLALYACQLPWRGNFFI